MLPKFLDLSHLGMAMWLVMIIGAIVILLVIKSVEKAMLRVFVFIFLAVLCGVCYFYQKELTECKNTGKECTFFGYKVPNVNIGEND